MLADKRTRGLAAAVVLAGSLTPVVVARAAAQAVPPSTIEEASLDLGDGTEMRYGIALPAGYTSAADEPRPLVVVLHPGGRAPYYGSDFMQSIVEPALRSWGAMIVAPDVPDRSWATARSESAVLALVEHVAAERAIDRTRVLVTGYSMGGRGTWYMAARHGDVFTGAIVMAGSPDDQDIERMSIPIFLIHSPDDEVVPFGPAEEAYTALAVRGHPVEMRVLPGASHYMMGAYVPVLRVAGRWMLERWGVEPR